MAVPQQEAAPERGRSRSRNWGNLTYNTNIERRPSSGARGSVRKVKTDTNQWRQNRGRPSAARDDATRNVALEERIPYTSPTAVPKSSNAAKTTDEIFFESYEQQGLQPTGFRENQNTRRENRQQGAEVTNLQQNVSQYRNPRKLTLSRKLHVKKNVRSAWQAAKFTKLLGTSISLGSFLLTLWVLQMVLALLSLFFLGLAAALEAVYRSVIQITEGGNIFYQVGGWVFKGLSSAAEAVNEFINSAFGVDFLALLNALNPVTWFIATWGLAWLLGIVTLLLIALVYTVTFTNAFFGKNTEWKITAFLFALVGYAIPILNVFPLFIPWMVVVVFSNRKSPAR